MSFTRHAERELNRPSFLASDPESTPVPPLMTSTGVQSARRVNLFPSNVDAYCSEETSVSFMIPTRNELAIHEAGHAYAFAALMRADPNELGLGVNGAGQHHGWCNRREILNRDVVLAGVKPDTRVRIESQAAAEVVCAVAGTLADARYRHRSRVDAAFFVYVNAEHFLRPGAFDVDGDFQRVRDTLDYIGATDRLGTFKRLINVSEQILAANWPSTARLSRELARLGIMGRSEIADWFRRHPAKPFVGEIGI